MEDVTLKHGRGIMRLRKSPDLIAIRPSPQADVMTVLANAPTDTAELGTKLDEFEIVKVNDSKVAMEKTLDDLRTHRQVDAGSHVYYTGDDSAPIVPTGKVTLRFTPYSTDEQRQRILSENHLEIVESSVERTNGTDVETFTVKTTPASDNPLKVVERLQQSESVVALAEPDLATRGSLFIFQVPVDILVREQWHLKNTGSQFGTTLGLKAGADAGVVEAWKTTESLGSPSCIVAIIDDGFDLTHPDLSGNSKVVAPWDFGTNTNDPSPKRFNVDPRRGDYHGTACAGVAVGNANGVGITGAAPDCRFMPVRWTGTISDDTIKAQFAYVANQGAWVLSCSWGVDADYYQPSTVMNEAIAKCARSGRHGLGCVIVFAAGNSNHDINDPAGRTLDGFAVHPDVIAVAACNSLDEKSNYSNFGKEISVCAPSNGSGGRGILTTDVRGTFQFNGTSVAAGYDAGDYTRTFGGTSSATPLVAGICALILSVNPGLTAREVRQILESTTRKIGPRNAYDRNGHSILFGYGCVNADAAVKKARESLNPAVRLPDSRPEAGNGNGKPVANEQTLYGSEFWNISRHELIATIATGFLSVKAQSRISKLLKGQTLTQVAGWADQIKGRSPSPDLDADTNDFLRRYPNDQSKPWHYVDLPLGIESYARGQDMGFTRKDDVVQIISECVLVLQGRSTFLSELNALRWLVHLVGDVHQPLHVGCGFIDQSQRPPRLEKDPNVIRSRNLPSDRGGNSLVLPISGSINLHSYWDTYLPSDQESGNVSTLNFASNPVVRRGVEVAINNIWGRIKRSRIGAGNQIGVAVLDQTGEPNKWAIDWANASLVEARRAYRFVQIEQSLGNGRYKVSWPGKDVYNAEFRPVVSKQIAAAADNLAKLLNTIL